VGSRERLKKLRTELSADDFRFLPSLRLSATEPMATGSAGDSPLTARRYPTRTNRREDER
jgi:hypothetical protein